MCYNLKGNSGAKALKGRTADNMIVLQVQ